jgi:long-subunit fatty acid transport protein
MTIAGSETEIEATIDFPEVIVLGYAFKPSEKWKFEVNLDWTHWSNVDDISIDMSGQTIVQSQDMRNTIAYKFGSEYKYSEKLALRCGYIYNENATEDSSWRPSLPDTDIHFFTAGFGYSMGKMTIDTALQIVYYETRTIDNNVDFNEFASTSSIDGTYRTWAPCVSVAATYSF